MRRGSHDEGMELMHHRCDLDQRSLESPLMTAVNICGWRGYRMGCTSRGKAPAGWIAVSEGLFMPHGQE